MSRIGKSFTTNETMFAKGFLLVSGTKFTVIDKSGREYTVELHNKIKRQLTVGTKFFVNARCTQVN